MSDRWPALLSRKEAAEYLGISAAQVSLMKANKQIRSVKFGTKILYRRTELDDLIESLEYGDGYCAASEQRMEKENAARKARRKANAAQPPERSHSSELANQPANQPANQLAEASR